jgi:hypothetical protein
MIWKPPFANAGSASSVDSASGIVRQALIDKGLAAQASPFALARGRIAGSVTPGSSGQRSSGPIQSRYRQLGRCRVSRKCPLSVPPRWAYGLRRQGRSTV